MQLPDDRLLATAPEGTVFLVLAWQEMFDAYVPDTFQPRLFNLPLLIDELQSVARRAEASPQWEPHMQAIQAEMAQALQWDRTFLGGLPYFRWAASTLVKESTPKQLVEAATTLQIHRGRYQELAQHALLGTAGGLPNEKEAAFRALRRVATIAVNLGFRQEDFSELCGSANFSRPTAD